MAVYVAFGPTSSGGRSVCAMRSRTRAAASWRRSQLTEKALGGGLKCATVASLRCSASNHWSATVGRTTSPPCSGGRARSSWRRSATYAGGPPRRSLGVLSRTATLGRRGASTKRERRPGMSRAWLPHFPRERQEIQKNRGHGEHVSNSRLHKSTIFTTPTTTAARAPSPAPAAAWAHSYPAPASPRPAPGFEHSPPR